MNSFADWPAGGSDAKVITLANHNELNQHKEPITTRTGQINVTGTKRGKMSASKSRLVSVAFEKLARVLSTNHRV